MNVTYDVSYDQDDTPVRGNAQVSEFPEQDRETENMILAELDRGNYYAWALLKVTAKLEIEGETFEGVAYLGGCSAESEAQLFAQADDYNMKSEALADLEQKLWAAHKRGNVADRALLALSKL